MDSRRFPKDPWTGEDVERPLAVSILPRLSLRINLTRMQDQINPTDSNCQPGRPG